LNKWVFSRVFQAVWKPIRRVGKTAIRQGFLALEIRIFLEPAAAGQGEPDSTEWQSAGELLEV
jgi:hypothetical protein